MGKKKRLVFRIFAMIFMVSIVNGKNLWAEEIKDSANIGDNLEITDNQDIDMPYLQDNIIEPAFIKTSSQAAEYSQTEINIPEGEEEEVTFVYPVAIPEKGAVTFSVLQSNEIAFRSLHMELYFDALCTEQCGDTIYYLENNTYGQGQSFCPYAGTYYLKLIFSRQTGIYDAKGFILYSSFISNADRNMKEDTLLYSYADNDHSDIMYKIKIKKTGVIAFAAFPISTSDLTGNIQLYNAKKKAISSKNQISSTQGNITDNDVRYAKIYYTVKKGTYYLKFSSSQTYFAGYVLEKVKDTSGVSKAKAKNLAIKGKIREGVVLLSDSTKKTDWYKIKLKKRTKFTIVIESYVNGRLKMEVCNSKGKTVSFGKNYLYTAKSKLRTSSKWEKGVYYIKINKDSKKSSGYYRLKIK